MASETALDRVSRLITLIPLLSQQGIALDKLAAAAGVSKETITRDLEIIFMCGLPGYTPDLLIDLTLEGEQVSIRDPQNLDRPEGIENEIFIFSILGLHLLKQTVNTDTSDFSNIQNLLNKLESVNHSLVKFDESESIGYLSLVREAIDTDKCLRFDYEDMDGRRTSGRLVTPSEVVWRNGQALLKGIDLDINEYRHFYISKLSSISIVDRDLYREETFVSKPEMREAESLRIRISTGQGWWLRLMRPMITSLATLSDGRIEVELSYWNEDWLIRALAGIYGSCEILGDQREGLEESLRAYLAAI
jgi:proteasome accessory factor C